jgi:hypothetical protein
MASNPANLAFRFLLELGALASYAYWGWNQHTGILRFVLAIGIPLIGATVWAVFRVPGEPAAAPVAVSGMVRLLIEFAIFGLAVFLLIQAHAQTAATILALLVLVHYGLSYDRIARFLTGK